jgi:hypothetical protein
MNIKFLLNMILVKQNSEVTKIYLARSVICAQPEIQVAISKEVTNQDKHDTAVACLNR